MEFEAPPCQSIKRAATAPVEGQEATRLAGGRTGDGMTFYDGRPRAASACEVGDRGADRATTANHDARARANSSYCVRLDSPAPGQRSSSGTCSLAQARAHDGWRRDGGERAGLGLGVHGAP